MAEKSKLSVPENVSPSDRDLYQSIKARLYRERPTHSLYRSAELVRRFKDAGGRYTSKKPRSGGETARWFKEEWIRVVPFLESGKRIECGAGAGGKACRPTKKIDKDTPSTIQELIKKHGKEKLLAFAKRKTRNQKGTRANWDTLTLSKVK